MLVLSVVSIVFFESERLWFRPVEPEDATLLSGWVNHPEVRCYLDHRVFPISHAAEVDWINRTTKAMGVRSDVVFLFGEKGKKEPLGASGLHDINWVARKATWGVLIDPKHHGKGFGKEVTRRMLEYAFLELNLERVELEVVEPHAKARHVYEAAGYVEEGRRRSSFWFGGKLEDAVIMSVLRSEWDLARRVEEAEAEASQAALPAKPPKQPSKPN